MLVWRCQQQRFPPLPHPLTYLQRNVVEPAVPPLLLSMITGKGGGVRVGGGRERMEKEVAKDAASLWHRWEAETRENIKSRRCFMSRVLRGLAAHWRHHDSRLVLATLARLSRGKHRKLAFHWRSVYGNGRKIKKKTPCELGVEVQITFTFTNCQRQIFFFFQKTKVLPNRKILG